MTSDAGAEARGLRWSDHTPSSSQLRLDPRRWKKKQTLNSFWQVSVIESYFVLFVVTRPFIFRAKKLLLLGDCVLGEAERSSEGGRDRIERKERKKEREERKEMAVAAAAAVLRGRKGGICES